MSSSRKEKDPGGISLSQRNPAAAGERPDRGGELQSLTPLRGIAALWVVLFHYAVVYFPSLHPDDYTNLLGKGYLAVDLFFMLSGFVLAHVYRDTFSQEPGRHYAKFMFARVARLYPLHLFVLLLFVATALAARAAEYATTGRMDPMPWEGAQSVSAFIANLFMLQGLKASQLSWNYPAWSISVEFMAYLGFPFALAAMARAPRACKLVLGLLLVGALAGFAYWTRDDFNQWDGPQTLLRCLPEFIGGMILYDFYRQRALPVALSRDWLFLLIALLLVLLLHLGAPDLIIILSFPALILAAVSNNGGFAGLVNTRPLTWLGEISYSLYLIHGFIQFIMTQLLAGTSFADRAQLSAATSFALAATMLSVSLILATITYYGVERVGRRYLRDVLGVRRNRKAAPSPRHAHVPRDHSPEAVGG